MRACATFCGHFVELCADDGNGPADVAVEGKSCTHVSGPTLPRAFLLRWFCPHHMQATRSPLYHELARALYRRSLVQARSLPHKGARTVIEAEIAGRWRAAAKAAAADKLSLTRLRDRNISLQLAQLARREAAAGRALTADRVLSVQRAVEKNCQAELRRRDEDRLRTAACTVRFLREANRKMNLARAVLINMTEFRRVSVA